MIERNVNEMEQQTIITVEDVMKILGVSSKQTIYNYIADGKLTPTNKDDWHIERRYEFDLDDVNRLKEELRPPGLTTSEVAALLEVSQTTVNKIIRNGQLKAFQQEFRGKIYNFVNEDDLQEFQLNHEIESRPTKKNFYDKEKNITLFQAFKKENESSIELARIVSISEDTIQALTEHDEILTFEQLLEKGFTPAYQITELKQNTKEGYATLKFKAPKYVRSKMYSILDLIYQQVGPTNMRVEKAQGEGDVYIIEVKPSLIVNDGLETFELFQSCLIDGEIKKRKNGVYIGSDVQIIRLRVSKKEKKELALLMKNQGFSSIEELLLSSTLNKAFNKNGLN